MTAITSARQIAIQASREASAEKRLKEAQRLANQQAERQQELLDAMRDVAEAPFFGWFPDVVWEPVEKKGAILTIRSVEQDPLYLRVNVNDLVEVALLESLVPSPSMRSVVVHSAADVGEALWQWANQGAVRPVV